MPDDAGTIHSETSTEISIPRTVPAAGVRISRISTKSLKRRQLLNRYAKEDLAAKKAAKERKKKLAEDLAEIDATAAPFGHEVLEFIRRTWLTVTNGGRTKTVKFMTGQVAFENLPDRAVVHDKEKFLKDARERGLINLITVTPDEPNVNGLNADIEIARTFDSVTVIERSKVTIDPAHGWGVLRAEIPRKMRDTREIEELLGKDPLDWTFVSPSEPAGKRAGKE